MKPTSSMEETRPEVIRNILDVAARLVAEGCPGLSLATIAKAGNIPASSIRAVFPKIESLVDALYLDLVARKTVAVLALHDPTQSLTDRAYAIWHGYVIWALKEPVPDKALNSLNLGDLPSDKARAVEALNFPDMAVAEQFADNQICANCDPMYADALVIAIVDTTAKLIKLNPDQENDYLRTGFGLVQRLFLQ